MQESGFLIVSVQKLGLQKISLSIFWGIVYIKHPIEFLSVELAVVILDVLHMDVGQLLIALPFFDRPMGIPFGILHP